MIDGFNLYHVSYQIKPRGNDAELLTAIIDISPIAFIKKLNANLWEIAKEKAEKEKEAEIYFYKNKQAEYKSSSKWHKFWNISPPDLPDDEIVEFYENRLLYHTQSAKLISWQEISKMEYEELRKLDLIDDIYF
jgi:hypothetical protein